MLRLRIFYTDQLWLGWKSSFWAEIDMKRLVLNMTNECIFPDNSFRLWPIRSGRSRSDPMSRRPFQDVGHVRRVPVSYNEPGWPGEHRRRLPNFFSNRRLLPRSGNLVRPWWRPREDGVDLRPVPRRPNLHQSLLSFLPNGWTEGRIVWVSQLARERHFQWQSYKGSTIVNFVSRVVPD